MVTEENDGEEEMVYIVSALVDRKSENKGGK